MPCRALLHVLPGLFRQEGEGRGIVAGKILAIGVAEQKLGKSPGGLAGLDASRCIADQGCPGLVVTPRRHNLPHFPRHPTAGAIVRLILECSSSSAIVSTESNRVSEILGLGASIAPDDNVD